MNGTVAWADVSEHGDIQHFWYHHCINVDGKCDRSLVLQAHCQWLRCKFIPRESKNIDPEHSKILIHHSYVELPLSVSDSLRVPSAQRLMRIGCFVRRKMQKNHVLVDDCGISLASACLSRVMQWKDVAHMIPKIL